MYDFEEYPMKKENDREELTPEPTESTAEPEPTEFVAEPEPMESTAEPEPTESVAEPEPMESTAESEPMESVAEPEPTETMAEPEPMESTADAPQEPKYRDTYDGPRVREYHYEEQVKKAPQKKRGWAKLIVACLIVSIVGGMSMGAGYGLVQYGLRGKGGSSTPAVVASSAAVKSSYSKKDIIRAVKPSVVSISTKVTGVTQYFGAFSVPYEASGAGSGVVFYSDENRVAIATNNHVIEDANSVYVTFEGDVSVPAKVIGTKSDSDLAVLTVSWSDLRENGIDHVTTAVFGDSDALEVGDEVIAIGNAMGQGISATDGIISMTEQSISVDGNTLSVLQTSAAINSGNSGGALVNSAGEVIGINTAKYNSTMAEGMGYAIPSNVITPIVEELLQTGTAPKPYIGITGTSITEATAPSYELPVGALIMEIVEDGPADRAGLEVGDVITAFNGSAVTSMDKLIELVGQVEIGSSVQVKAVRNGKPVQLQLTIADKNS